MADTDSGTKVFLLNYQVMKIALLMMRNPRFEMISVTMDGELVAEAGRVERWAGRGGLPCRTSVQGPFSGLVFRTGTPDTAPAWCGVETPRTWLANAIS